MFYRGMDIGTAKPTLSDRNRVPHHLIDVTEPDQPWSLATFQDHAHQALMEIHARGHLPLLVGGTGQYLRAVVQDWQLPRVEPDWRLREALEDWAGEIGLAGIHQRLSLIDPQAASSIDARNLRRSIRALEVIFTTGVRFSEQRRSGSSHYQVLQVGLTMPRAILFERIDRRIESMLESGLVAEVKNLLERGFPPIYPSFPPLDIARSSHTCRGASACRKLKWKSSEPPVCSFAGRRTGSRSTILASTGLIYPLPVIMQS